MKTAIIGNIVGLLAFAGVVPALEVVVKPGSEIATLPAARDAVRALRSSGETGDIDVIIHDGTYTLDETLVFGLEDSAPKGAVTRYRAAKGASPLISGGRVITGWEKSELQHGSIWVASVPWAKGDAFFLCLYDGTTLLQRAQSEGFRVEVDANRRQYAGGEQSLQAVAVSRRDSRTCADDSLG